MQLVECSHHKPEAPFSQPAPFLRLMGSWEEDAHHSGLDSHIPGCRTGSEGPQCIFCTKLKTYSSPNEPKVRDGPSLPGDHFHFPESEKMETIGLMEWSFVVMVAGEKTMNTQSQPNNVSFGS